LARGCGADYVIRLSPRLAASGGFVRVPGQGSVLTWCPLADDPPGRHLDDWVLTLGDVELM
jgi:hypothetical protein